MSIDRIMREEARLVILKALADEPSETLNSSLLGEVLGTFGIYKPREWVHAELGWLAEMGAITVMDAGTVMGMQLAEDLGRKFGLREDEEGSGLVWAIKLNPGWYNEHFPPLKTAFEDGSIALVRDADHLGDLRLVKIIRGVPQVPPERIDQKADAGGDGPKKKRHGDFAVMLGLAHFASRMQWHEYGYQAVPSGTSSTRWQGGDDFWNAGDDISDGAGREWWKPPLGTGLRGGI